MCSVPLLHSIPSCLPPVAVAHTQKSERKRDTGESSTPSASARVGELDVAGFSSVSVASAPARVGELNVPGSLPSPLPQCIQPSFSRFPTNPGRTYPKPDRVSSLAGSLTLKSRKSSRRYMIYSLDSLRLGNGLLRELIVACRHLLHDTRV
ncbi:hypothetical protein M011DRAFT_471028 [Sporormia fimetaria CBS 119925]|uniref:Uncharacterized protein n=1 Tax=Sporormia fimetaria CBS 119925 TaxID=1340428 RepID=A0A6A6V1W3_9PLEO|nr:hypothetical protein M011DRAFT_471028 [Sporormia fimetaria CBS 119925]